MLNRWLAGVRARWQVLLVLAGITSVLTVMGRSSQLAQKEREVVFRIEPGTATWYAGLPRGVQEFYLPISSGRTAEHIHSWWWPAARHDAPALLYLHGSRWNLTGQLFRIAQLHDFGFSVLAIDYRGFGESKGKLPSENTVYEDARIAWERLAQLQPEAARRFIYGHSLGGAVAIDLAASLSKASRPADAPAPAAGLIVESSFTTLAQLAMALNNTKWPIHWILSQRFDSKEKIADVRMPILLVHGTDDHYVPARFSEELYAAAAEPKRLLLIKGATHNNSMRTGSAAYRGALHELFGLHAKAAEAPPV